MTLIQKLFGNCTWTTNRICQRNFKVTHNFIIQRYLMRTFSSWRFSSIFVWIHTHTQKQRHLQIFNILFCVLYLGKITNFCLLSLRQKFPQVWVAIFSWRSFTFGIFQSNVLEFFFLSFLCSKIMLLSSDHWSVYLDNTWFHFSPSNYLVHLEFILLPSILQKSILTFPK